MNAFIVKYKYELFECKIERMNPAKGNSNN